MTVYKKKFSIETKNRIDKNINDITNHFYEQIMISGKSDDLVISNIFKKIELKSHIIDNQIIVIYNRLVEFVIEEKDILKFIRTMKLNSLLNSVD